MVYSFRIASISSHRQGNTSRGALGGEIRDWLLNVCLSVTYIFKQDVSIKMFMSLRNCLQFVVSLHICCNPPSEIFVVVFFVAVCLLFFFLFSFF